MLGFGFAEEQQQITQNTLFARKQNLPKKMTFCTTYHQHMMACLKAQATTFKMSTAVSFCLIVVQGLLGTFFSSFYTKMVLPYSFMVNLVSDYPMAF